MDDETKPQEGTEEAPGAQQTDDAGSASLEARLALMEREAQEARKEAASYRRKLREQEEAQRLAQEAKLREDKKWEELAKLKDAELADIRANAETERLRALRMEVAMKTGLPVPLATRLMGSSLEELEADAATILALLPKPGEPAAIAPKPAAPNIDSTSVPPAKADKTPVSKLTAEQINTARKFGLTPEEYAKYL